MFAIMFIRVIMRKTKVFTVAMQRPKLNILDALSLIDATVLSLKRIRNSKSEMNNKVDASVQFAKSTIGLDPELELRRREKERQVRELMRTSTLQLPFSFILIIARNYRGSGFTHHRVQKCLEKIKPLTHVLQLPVTIPHQQIKAVIILLIIQIKAVTIQNLKYL